MPRALGALCLPATCVDGNTESLAYCLDVPCYCPLRQSDTIYSLLTRHQIAEMYQLAESRRLDTAYKPSSLTILSFCWRPGLEALSARRETCMLHATLFPFVSPGLGSPRLWKKVSSKYSSQNIIVKLPEDSTLRSYGSKIEAVKMLRPHRSGCDGSSWDTVTACRAAFILGSIIPAFQVQRCHARWRIKRNGRFSDWHAR